MSEQVSGQVSNEFEVVDGTRVMGVTSAMETRMGCDLRSCLCE